MYKQGRKSNHTSAVHCISTGFKVSSQEGSRLYLTGCSWIVDLRWNRDLRECPFLSCPPA